MVDFRWNGAAGGALAALAFGLIACSSDDPGDGGPDADPGAQPDADGDEAAFVLGGALSGSMGGASVRVDIGDQRFETDAAGAISFAIGIEEEELASFEADDFVRVRAEDPADGDVAFASGVGTWGDVEAAAEGGAVDQDDVARLRVDAVRAAEYGLVKEESGGEAPTEWGAFEDLADGIADEELRVAAAALELIAATSAVDFANREVPEAYEDTLEFAGHADSAMEYLLDAAADPALNLAPVFDEILAHEDTQAGTYESESAPVYADVPQPLTVTAGGAWVPTGEEAGRIRREGFDGAEVGFEDGEMRFDYDGALTIEADWTIEEAGQLIEVRADVTYLTDQLTLLAEGEGADLVLVESQREVEVLNSAIEDRVQEPRSARVLYRPEGRLELGEASLEGDWVLNFGRESLALRERTERSPDDLRLQLEEGGAGEVLEGGWNAGETIDWSIDDGVLSLEAGDESLSLELFDERSGFYHGVLEAEDGGGDRFGHRSTLMPADHDTEWSEEDVEGVYLWGNAEDSYDGFALSLEEDQSGAVYVYDHNLGAWLEDLPLGWSLEGEELVLRSCAEAEEEARGLTEEPEAGECDGFYDRRAKEPALLEDDRAHLIDIRDFWLESDFESEDPDAVWRAWGIYWGRYDDVDELPAPVPGDGGDGPLSDRRATESPTGGGDAARDLRRARR